MPVNLEQLYESLRSRARSYGIAVRDEALDAETAGKFDGVSITMNTKYDLEERCYYFVHAVGSIVQWSVAPEWSRGVYDEVRAAKTTKRSDPQRLERAIDGYRAFEEHASEYAVWLLADLGYGEIVPSYTNFARADIEALAEFHRRGVAPVWRDFFAKWNQQVRQGQRQIRPYESKPVPAFHPVRIETQEVLQEVDGEP